MTMICDGPERVVLGVGPPAVPSRMSRELGGAGRAAGAKSARGAPDASGATRSAADCRRKSRRFTPAIVTGGLRHTVTPAHAVTTRHGHYDDGVSSVVTSGLTTLPMALRGSAATQRRSLGTLYGARRAFVHACSSSSESAAPGRSSTAADTRSPHSGSGMPTMAQSETLGWARTTSSISRADTL